MVTNGLSIASIRGLGVASGVEGVAMNEPRPSIRGVPSESCEVDPDGSEGGGRGRYTGRNDSAYHSYQT